ncbi:hypothetical protein [Novosphingobium subterraneum]|uniref:hypothetical protein n=1 Tax=Novosphingobium subterraneum TaxID=48936 RepID=UPI0012E04AE0|nr:hypothetical protein [Novosphingobium subterraneum]
MPMLVTCAMLSWPIGAVPAQQPRFTADLQLKRSVGRLRAGQFCLPKGSISGADFISDTPQFDLLMRQTLDAQPPTDQILLGSGSAPKIEVHFKSAEVKLCAKSWGMFGMGDTKSLSGKAAFTFTWKKDGQKALAVETIALEVNGKERLTAPAILRRAVNVLCGRIAASGQ